MANSLFLPTNSARWAAVLASIMAFLFIICTHWQLASHQHLNEKSHVTHLAQDYAQQFQQGMDEIMSLNYTLSSMVQFKQSDTEFFIPFAQNILSYYPYVTHLALVKENDIPLIYPLDDNKNLLSYPHAQQHVFFPESTSSQPSTTEINKHISLSGPLTLSKGTRVMVGRLSIYTKTKNHPVLWGFVQVVVDLDALLNKQGIKNLSASNHYFLLESRDTVPHTVIATNTTQLNQLKNPVITLIPLADQEWVLSILPKVGWTLTQPSLLILFLAFLGSGILGMVTFFLVKIYHRRKELKKLVYLRTRQLIATQHELQATLDAIPDYLFEIDSNYTIINFHTQQHEFIAYPPDKIIGKKFTDILCPINSQKVIDTMANARRDGICTGDHFSVLVGPHTRHFEMTMTCKNNAENYQTFLVLSRDITERLQTERELRIAATAFESRDGMMITDHQGIILRVNKAFYAITGYESKDVLGKTPKILNSGIHDKRFYQVMWNTISETGSWQGEIWNRRADGDIYPEWLSIAAVKNCEGVVTNYVSTLNDISVHKENEKRIKTLSNFDPLTQLPNRALLLSRLQTCLSSRPEKKLWNALLYIDINDFKLFNDNCGQEKGDLLLCSIADKLTIFTRRQDTLARLNSDKFSMLMLDLAASSEPAANYVQQQVEEMLANIAQSHNLNGEEVFCTASIGICLFQQDSNSVDDLFLQAEQAMNHAKTSNERAYAFFDHAMQMLTAKRFSIRNDIREALRLEQFVLYYQSQANQDNKIIGAEALIRWFHPERGMVPPSEFISIAEESDLIFPLGQWILHTACAQLVTWSQHEKTSHLTLSVNMSARQFNQPQFVENILDALASTGANPEKLILELTESMLVADQEDIIIKMSRLKSYGIRFSLDDFGTGYSSLSYLKKLPINELKIDQSFVKEALTDSNDAAIARMIIRLAQSMELTVIAEGVEFKEHRDWLFAQGCLHYQGYHFGRPVPPAEFLENPYL